MAVDIGAVIERYFLSNSTNRTNGKITDNEELVVDAVFHRTIADKSEIKDSAQICLSKLHIPAKR